MMKKICNTATVLCFVLLVFGLAAAFWILPDSAFSDAENRALAPFPEFSFETLTDGSFNSGMTDYFADQFPARSLFVRIKAECEIAVGRGENNGVLLGKHDQLAVRKFRVYESLLRQTPDMDYYYRENVALSLDALNAYAAGETRPLVTLLPPRAVDVAASALSYPGEITDALHAQITKGLSPETGYLDLLPLFREHYDAGEYVYFRTDHHWTPEGAYLAYREVMKGFGIEDRIKPPEDFTVEEIPGFYGTTWSKSQLKFIEPDTIRYLSPGNEDRFETSCLSARMVKDENGKPKKVKEVYESFPGWMKREYFDKKDKYAAFLGGTHNEQLVTIPTTDAERERLLIMKDSFANTLVPYLAQHFDLVIGNLTGGVTNASELAEEYGCSRVLVVYNWENLITAASLAGIK